MKPLIDGRSADRETAEETICHECQWKMAYEQRDNGETGEYKAWAICTNPECDNEFEF